MVTPCGLKKGGGGTERSYSNMNWLITSNSRFVVVGDAFVRLTAGFGQTELVNWQQRL